MQKPNQKFSRGPGPVGPGGPRKDRPRRDSRPGGPRRFGRGPFTRKSTAPAANSHDSTPIPMPEGLIFYCKSCEQIVDFKPPTFDFKYPIENCLKAKADKTEEKKAELMCDITYGTERSIKHFYKIKDEKFDKERKEREEKAAKADKF